MSIEQRGVLWQVESQSVARALDARESIAARMEACATLFMPRGGPQQFLQDASTKGYGSINLFFGHGNGHTDFNLEAALKKLDSSNGAAPPLFGIGACFAKLLNEQIPPQNQVPNYPTNAGKIMAGSAPAYWRGMISSVDEIIRERINNGKTVQVNLYFGEIRMNSYEPDPTDPAHLNFGRWVAHSHRYQDWK